MVGVGFILSCEVSYAFGVADSFFIVFDNLRVEENFVFEVAKSSCK